MWTEPIAEFRSRVQPDAHSDSRRSFYSHADPKQSAAEKRHIGAREAISGRDLDLAGTGNIACTGMKCGDQRFRRGRFFG